LEDDGNEEDDSDFVCLVDDDIGFIIDFELFMTEEDEDDTGDDNSLGMFSFVLLLLYIEDGGDWDVFVKLILYIFN